MPTKKEFDLGVVNEYLYRKAKKKKGGVENQDATPA